MNCAEKLLEPTIFFNLYTKSTKNSGSESPCRKKDLSTGCFWKEKNDKTFSLYAFTAEQGLISAKMENVVKKLSDRIFK